MRGRPTIFLCLAGLALGGLASPAAALLTFEGYPTGTVITTQYLAEGVVFSGVGTDPDPETFDYGPPLTSTLRSYDWYAPMRIAFVEPSNPGTYRPASRVEFDNPITGEVDYIVVRAYDASDQLVFSYTSTSPERIVVDTGSSNIAYLILDDDLKTAYVIDNLEAFDTPIATQPQNWGEIKALYR